MGKFNRYKILFNCMKLKNKDECPWCDYEASAYTDDGLEISIRRHAMDEHPELFEKYLELVDEWNKDWDNEISEADSVTEKIKKRYEKFFDSTPRLKDVNRNS